MHLLESIRRRKFVLLFMMVLVCLAGRAQIYPVQVSTQIVPPYSVYLPDYASPGGEKLRLVLLQRDLTVQGYRLRFEMKVQLNGVTIIQTSRSAMPPPVTLQPGVPTVLGGSDLSWYIQPQNMEFGGGFSSAAYEQTRSLPEGPVTITFTAYDYTRSDVQVSLPATAYFYATRDNPPLLNYPACGMQIAPINPQFLNFSWVPQNTSSPNSALQTNYIFSLYAVLPAGYNFQDVVQNSQPVFQTTTQQPNFVYGPGQPLLTPGQMYAWRVQAVDITGRDIFRNNGYSETCNFTYGGDSSMGIISYPDIQLSAASAGSAQGKLWWAAPDAGSLAAAGYQQYRLYYRKSQGNFSWFSVDVSDTMYRIFNLEPGTSYDCRLQGYKSGSYGPYTNVVSFVTDAQKAVSCTDSASMLSPYSGRPLAAATPGMNISYGPWVVQLLTVQPLGQAGQYKGTCTVSVPFMGGTSFNAKFDNLTIDDSRNVTAGTIVLLSQGLQNFIDSSISHQMGGDSYGKVVSGTDTAQVDVPVSLAGLTDLPIVLGPDSTIASFTIPGNPPVVVNVPDSMQEVTIRDTTGSTYALDNQGHLTQLSLTDGSLQNFFADAGNVASLDTLATGKGVVRFTDADSKFAFDAWQPFYAQATTILTGQYEKLNGDYYVAQKAIGAGESDIVGLNIQLADGMTPDSLVFATGKGQRLVWDPTDHTLNLLGGPAADAQEVYALYPKPGGGYYSLGKLLVSAYEEQHFTAVIVPVVAADSVTPVIDAQQYADSLNSIYNKVNVFWTVKVDDAYRNPGWDLDGDGKLTMTGSSFLSNKLNGEPAALIKGYKGQRSPDGNTRYIFVLNTSSGSTGEAGVAGDMPRATQYGFIFLDQAGAQAQTAVTIAHELGHGQFNLEHTFSGDIALGSRGATASWPNLMDYTGASYVRLYKYQWNQVHQPGKVMGIFESDTAGQSMDVGDMKPFRDAGFFNKEDSSYTFYSPAGTLITLPKAVTAVRFWAGDRYSDSTIGAGSYPDGALLGFTLNNKQYNYSKVVGANQGAGYYASHPGSPYVDSISKKLQKVTTALLGLPCVQGGEFSFKVYQLSFDGSLPKENSVGDGVIDSTLPVASMYNADFTDNNITVPAKLMVVQPYTQEAIDFLSQNNSCGQPYTRYLMQIADLITANPGSYAGYKHCTGDSLVYADTSTSVGKGRGLIVYRYKVEGFAALLKAYITTKANAYSGIMNTDDPGVMGGLLQTLCPDDYKPLTAAQRVHILRVLADGGNLQDSWLGMGNNRENVVIYTITSTPVGVGQSKVLLDAMQADHYSLLKELIAGCDNQLVGKDNFDQLMNGVTVLIQDAYPDKKLAYQYANDRILKYGKGPMGDGYFYKDTWKDGSDSIEFDVTGGHINYPAEEYAPEGITFDQTYYNSLKVAPYDYVTLDLYGDVLLSDGTPLLQRSVDSVQSVPALYLYWVLQTNATRNTLSSIRAGINFGLFALGAGELESAQGLSLALAITDNVTMATGFVLDAGLRSKLTEGSDSAQWRPILKGFDAFNLLYGTARLGQGLTSVAKGLAARRAAFNQLRASDNALLTPAEQNELQAADNELAELERETGTTAPAGPDLTAIYNMLAGLPQDVANELRLAVQNDHNFAQLLLDNDDILKLITYPYQRSTAAQLVISNWDNAYNRLTQLAQTDPILTNKTIYWLNKAEVGKVTNLAAGLAGRFGKGVFEPSITRLLADLNDQAYTNLASTLINAGVTEIAGIPVTATNLKQAKVLSQTLLKPSTGETWGHTVDNLLVFVVHDATTGEEVYYALDVDAKLKSTSPTTANQDKYTQLLQQGNNTFVIRSQTPGSLSAVNDPSFQLTYGTQIRIRSFLITAGDNLPDGIPRFTKVQ